MNSDQRNRILHALHSLKEDAAWAWQLLLNERDSSGIKAVGDSYKNLEKLVIENDAIKR